MNALAQPADPTRTVVTIDLRTADQEQMQTVFALGAMLARLLIDEEIDAIHADPGAAADILLGAPILDRMSQRRRGWGPVSQYRLHAGAWAAVQSIDGMDLADFAELHASG